MFYLPDNEGSIRDLVDVSGAVTDHRNYTAFGIVQNETHPEVGDRFGYTGREFDADTGLQ